MNESNLWEWLRDVTLPLGHYDRIESGETAPGIPDVGYQLSPYQGGYIELKHSHTSPKDHHVPFTDHKKGMRQSQVDWMKSYIKRGGTAWVIAETPRCIYVFRGSDAGRINRTTYIGLDHLSIKTMQRDEPKTAAHILEGLLTAKENDNE